MRQTAAQELSAAHHALLFALIARAVFRVADEKRAEEVVRQAVRRYGEERGRRMALRAQANGHPLTMANYLAYGEWQTGKGEMKHKIAERVPHCRLSVSQCPWYRTWEQDGLVQYGRFYCREVDEALVRGFNPQLRLDVHGTLANGDKDCEFVFRDANLTIMRLIALAYRKPGRPGMAVMPWDYHLGHLWKTTSEVIIEELGDIGKNAAEAALMEFAGRYGEDAARMVTAYRDTDFSRLPE